MLWADKLGCLLNLSQYWVPVDHDYMQCILNRKSKFSGLDKSFMQKQTGVLCWPNKLKTITCACHLALPANSWLCQSLKHFLLVYSLTYMVNKICSAVCLNTHQKTRSLNWHNIYKHSQLQKCTDKLRRGWSQATTCTFALSVLQSCIDLFHTFII